MTMKTKTPSRAGKPQRQIFEVEDNLADVRDGLSRIRAIADLLQTSSPENHMDEDTLEAVAETIVREAESQRSLVCDAIEDLKAIKSQQRPAAVPLEVLEGGAS
jgi:hypothetical protein